MSATITGFGSVNEMSKWLEDRQPVIRSSIVGVPRERVEDALLMVVSGLKDAAIRKPDLLKVEPASILKAALLCARMNLYPGGGLPDVWLTPRWDSGVRAKVLQAEASWRGMMKMMQRAGVKALHCRPVFKGEVFESGTDREGPYLLHREDPEVEETFENLVLCYVQGVVDGERMHHICRMTNILRHRSASDAYKAGSGRDPSGPWKDHPVQMAMKTAIKDAALRGTFPFPDEMKDAALLDEVRVPDERDLPRGAVTQMQPRRLATGSSLGLREEEGVVEGVEVEHHQDNE